MSEALHSIWMIWLSGGWVMVPLALIALAIYISGTGLYIRLGAGDLRFGSPDKWASWVRDPASARDGAAPVLQYVTASPATEASIIRRFAEIRSVQLARIARRLQFLQTLVVAAPLLGLLGTVIGMFSTFSAIGLESGETLALVADGISTALITTQTGLFITLPGLFLILLIRRRKHSVEAALARLEGLCLAQYRRGGATT